MRQTLFPLAAFALLLAVPAIAQDQPAATPPPAPVAVTPAPSNPIMTGPRLLISTSMGDITLQLDSVRAPKSVANILRYVKEKHYDNTAFYRVAKDMKEKGTATFAEGAMPYGQLKTLFGGK